MKPLNLDIENFCGFGKTSLDFTRFNSALIIGVLNDNELVSNGVGKTTIFLAIEYALFNESAVILEKIIRDFTTKATVIFDFQFEGNVYRIKRQRTKTKSDVDLYIKENSNWTCLSGRRPSDTEKEIAKIIRVNYKSFQDTVHFVQRDMNGLATSSPENRKALLKNALDLEIYQKLEGFAKTAVSNTQKQLDLIKAKVTALGDPDTVISKVKIHIEQVEKEISERKIDISDKQCLIPGLESDIQNLSSDITKSKSQFDLIVSKKTGLETDIINIQKVIDNAATNLSKLSISGLESEITSLKELIEKTKSQLIDTSVTESEIKEIQTNMVTIGFEIKLNEEKLKDIEKTQTEMKNIVSNTNSVIANAKSIKSQLEQFQSQVLDIFPIENELATRRVEEVQILSNIKINEAKIKEKSNPIPGKSTCDACLQVITEEHRQKHEAESKTFIETTTSLNKVLKSRAIDISKSIKDLATEIDKQKKLQAQIQNLQTELSYKNKEIAQNQEQHRILKEKIESKADIELVLSTLKEKNRVNTQNFTNANAILSSQNLYHATIRSSEKDIVYKEREIVNIKNTITQLQEHLEVSKATIYTKNAELQEVIQNLYSIDTAHIELIKKQLEEKQIECDGIKASIKALEYQNNNLASELAVLEHKIRTAFHELEKIDILNKERLDLEDKLITCSDVVQAFSSTGIPNIIIQSVLSELERHTNTLLFQFNSGLRIEFIVEKEVKEKISDTLDIRYFVRGRERDFKLLSGAQKLSVSFGLKLGLSALLQSLLNIKVEFILLDEVDDSLDKASIDALSTIIRELEKQYKVLAITHNDRLKERFSELIVVKQDIDLVSEIIQ